MSAVPTLESEAIAKLCRAHGVSRLVIFGSAVRGDWDPATSDLDFLVEFHPSTPSLFDAYFNLKDEPSSFLGLPSTSSWLVPWRIPTSPTPWLRTPESCMQPDSRALLWDAIRAGELIV